MVVQRGFPKPASLHDERLRTATDQYLFDVITNGYGAMYSHGDRVEPRDRWAIVAYIRALQLSQHAALTDLPADVQARMTIESKP
jgi:cytosine/adenosine deaminase-related metal-dependent hydrolase